MLGGVQNPAGLAQQLWLRHVQPQPVREHLEGEVRVPHGLTIAVDLQASNKDNNKDNSDNDDDDDGDGNGDGGDDDNDNDNNHGDDDDNDNI